MMTNKSHSLLLAMTAVVVGVLAVSSMASMATEASAQSPAPTPEPSEAVKKASRSIYANYIGNTLTCWYTPKDTCHLWLYPNGTFDSFGYVNGKKTLNIPYPPRIGRRNRTGLSWWATGAAGQYRLCLKHNLEVLPQLRAMKNDGKVCYALQNRHKVGDVWEEPDGGGRISRMGVLKGFQ